MRAALLLEVVVALTILVAAMGILGAQLVGGLKLTGYAEQQARANQLTDRILALLELDPEKIQQLATETHAEGDFGTQYPGFLWRTTIEPITDVAGLGLVTVEILYDASGSKTSDIEAARVVRSVHLLKSAPGRVDLENDFGVDSEQIEQITQMVPIPGFDPKQLDPQAIVSLDPTQLLELLPQLLPLLQQFGGQAPPGLEGLLAGGPPSPEQIQELLRQRLSGATPDGGGGAPGGPGRGGFPGAGAPNGGSPAAGGPGRGGDQPKIGDGTGPRTPQPGGSRNTPTGVGGSRGDRGGQPGAGQGGGRAPRGNQAGGGTGGSRGNQAGSETGGTRGDRTGTGGAGGSGGSRAGGSRGAGSGAGGTRSPGGGP
ncbi:MAG: hypothetical protein U1D55_17715 [Phycisphaerae bacterium]